MIRGPRSLLMLPPFEVAVQLPTLQPVAVHAPTTLTPVERECIAGCGFADLCTLLSRNRSLETPIHARAATGES